MPFPQFPPNFLFGTATAAFQIEGSPTVDGKGRSIWDTFTHTPKKIRTGENADVACDTYLYPERDIEVMTELYLNAYRFSIAWTRVLPEGSGQVNQKGLDYYRRLVDLLLAGFIYGSTHGRTTKTEIVRLLGVDCAAATQQRQRLRMLVEGTER